MADQQTPRLALTAARLGLRLLREAWESADALQVSLWEFALELDALLAAGLSHNDLRVLLAEGMAERRREITRPSDRTRRYSVVHSLTFAPHDCFVLTAAGYQFAVQVLAAHHDHGSAISTNGHTTSSPSVVDAVAHHNALQPRWDARHRVLLFGDDVVKRFIHAAPAQELILSAFQEERWPSEIDDPLPLKGCPDPKRRLRQTVKNLNRAHCRPCLRFVLNPDAESIRWQLAPHRAETPRATLLRTPSEPRANPAGS